MMHRKLDGTFADKDNIKQSHVTTASLLLGGLFKATLTASVGLSFAQNLWHVLRGHPMTVRRIDRLFLLRNNIFLLGHPSNLRYAPILYSMAIYIWCIGIAMVYPPGSLTVDLGSFSRTSLHNLSVMMPPVLEEPTSVTGNKHEQRPSLADLRLETIDVENLNITSSGNSSHETGYYRY